MNATAICATAGDVKRFLVGIPDDAKFQVYNREAMEHTPVQLSFYGPDSNVSIKNVVIVDSNVYVTVEDYD